MKQSNLISILSILGMPFALSAPVMAQQVSSPNPVVGLCGQPRDLTHQYNGQLSPGFDPISLALTLLRIEPQYL